MKHPWSSSQVCSAESLFMTETIKLQNVESSRGKTPEQHLIIFKMKTLNHKKQSAYMLLRYKHKHEKKKRPKQTKSERLGS